MPAILSLHRRRAFTALAAINAAAITVAALVAPAFAGDPAANGAGDSVAALLPGDIARGDDAYVRLCLECHATPSRIVRLVPGSSDEARAAWLEEFLPEHYAPDAQDRIDLILYMLNL